MNNPITLRELNALKKLAKQAKHDHPDLSHAQRLDLVARQHGHVRSFHELRQQLNHAIESHLDHRDDNVAYCKLCRYTFATDVPGDKRLHEQHHELFEQALLDLGDLPAAYTTREEIKSEGHARMSAGTPEDALAGAEMVVRGWFDRSLESAIGGKRWRQHPSYEQYAAMVAETITPLMPSGADLFLSKYGNTPGIILRGYTNWHG